MSLADIKARLEANKDEYHVEFFGDETADFWSEAKSDIAKLIEAYEALYIEITHAREYLLASGAGDERLRGEPEFEMLESFEVVLRDVEEILK
jgi:hypothetical protein